VLTIRHGASAINSLHNVVMPVDRPDDVRVGLLGKMLLANPPLRVSDASNCVWSRVAATCQEGSIEVRQQHLGKQRSQSFPIDSFLGSTGVYAFPSQSHPRIARHAPRWRRRTLGCRPIDILYPMAE